MYLKRLIFENTGPIDNVSINFRIEESETIAPHVFVGENGSGKSVLLSSIADALFEFADPGFQNATKKEWNHHKFFKVISGNQIKYGKDYMVSFLEFNSEDTKNLYYYCKSGKISSEAFKNRYSYNEAKDISWNPEEHDKGTNVDGKISKLIFGKNVLCYFSPSRYEKPNWLGDGYYSGEFITENSGFALDEKYNGVLKNPILVSDTTLDIFHWLLDVVADSRGDLHSFLQTDGHIGFKIDYPSPEDILLLSSARQNIEKIMSTILGTDIVFRMKHRNVGSDRFAIYDTKGNLLVSSLDSLSTGQMALFTLFATIIRYADHNDINKSFSLNQIQGIVLIDEIDLHLHSKLQRNVLPQLMRLFPKIQFIITTHSPLVLLGMNEYYGDNFDITEMPSGRYISAEQFSEFENAYRYYTSTQLFYQEIQKLVENTNNSIPLIITEGATDWRHIKAAYESLKQRKEYEWLNQLQFDFLKYDPSNCNSDNPIKMQMSAEELYTMIKEYSKIYQDKKMIFIADNDKPGITKNLMESGKQYKDWGNNVFSLTLPVPDFRKDTPEICIEYLYMDEELTQWVEKDDWKRRIFLGTEFDEDGFSLATTDNYYCRDKNACTKMQIIDGSGSKKVIIPKSENSNRNYALSKMAFAKMVLGKEKPFEKMSFEGFIPLFEVLRDILIGDINQITDEIAEKEKLEQN